MTDFSATASIQLCTTLDVRKQAQVLKQGIYSQPSDDSQILVTDMEIEGHVDDMSGMVAEMLHVVSNGINNLMASIPYSCRPINNCENSNWGTRDMPHLKGVTVGSGANTEMWEIKFTTSSAFSVIGQISGSQGSGTTGATFTSTNTDLVIPTGAWNTDGGNFQIDDRVYVSTYKVLRGVMAPVAMLAAAKTLDEIYSEASPNASEYGNSLWSRAMRYLDKFVKGDMRLSTTAMPSTEFVHVAYDITTLGDDTTEYQSDNRTGQVDDSFDKTIL